MGWGDLGGGRGACRSQFSDWETNDAMLGEAFVLTIACSMLEASPSSERRTVHAQAGSKCEV